MFRQTQMQSVKPPAKYGIFSHPVGVRLPSIPSTPISKSFLESYPLYIICILICIELYMIFLCFIHLQLYVIEFSWVKNVQWQQLIQSVNSPLNSSTSVTATRPGGFASFTRSAILSTCDGSCWSAMGDQMSWEINCSWCWYLPSNLKDLTISVCWKYPYKHMSIYSLTPLFWSCCIHVHFWSRVKPLLP